MLPLCAACLLLSGWMFYHAISGGQMAGCGLGGSCDEVTGSPWAYFLPGIPVSLPAMVLYILLGICVIFLGGESDEAKSLDRLLIKVLPFLGGCIVGAAIWFVWLQIGVVHAFCKYCTLLHLLGCVVAVVIAVFLVGNGQLRHTLLSLCFAAGLAAAALFAFVQKRTVPDSVYGYGLADALLPSFSEGELPVLGAGDNAKELTLMFDFQCIHCRRLHQILPELLSLSDLRIMLCPVPLSMACNPYLPDSGTDRFAGSCQLTRYALAVWYARPDAYSSYWGFLLGGEDVHAEITPAAAEALAKEILGDKFDAAMDNPQVDACISKAEELFGRTSSYGKSGVPRIIYGQSWLVPKTDNAQELLSLIQTKLFN